MRRILRLLLAPVLLAGGALGATYWFAPGALLDAEYARQAWLAGLSKRAIELDGHRWVYYEGGEGEPLVLVHGFAGSKENWLPLARELRGHRLIIPDLPGWGESTRRDDADYAIRAQAVRLEGFLAALDPGRVHLVGHSMGGHISGVLAAGHPRRLRSLALVDTAGVRFEENAFARRVQAGETPFNFRSVAELEAFAAELFVEVPWMPQRLKQVLVERSLPRHAFQARLLREIGLGADAFLLERRLGEIGTPTLVLWCEDDRILDVSAVSRLHAGLADAAVVLLQGCSHMPMMERPARMASALQDFVREPVVAVALR